MSLLLLLIAFTHCKESLAQERGSITLELNPLAGKEGLAFYKVKNVVKADEENCHNCLAISVNDLEFVPLLSSEDIKAFHWEEQRIELSDEAKSRMAIMEIPLEGLPVAMVLDGEVIYTFWLWNVYSSFSCDRVYAYPGKSFVLGHGLPASAAFGEDPRFDPRIRTWLILQGL